MGENMRFTFDRDAMIKEVAIAQEIITNKSNFYLHTINCM